MNQSNTPWDFPEKKYKSGSITFEIKDLFEFQMGSPLYFKPEFKGMGLANYRYFKKHYFGGPIYFNDSLKKLAFFQWSEEFFKGQGYSKQRLVFVDLNTKEIYCSHWFTEVCRIAEIVDDTFIVEELNGSNSKVLLKKNQLQILKIGLFKQSLFSKIDKRD